MNYSDLTQLATYMVKAIASNPENRTEHGVNWDYVSADVYLGYDGVFDDALIEDAIDLILEAAGVSATGEVIH